jgi:hypothetical protein
VPAPRPDTLLRTTGGLAAAIRLVGDDSAGVGHVWLLSDVGLITNSGLQQAAVPEYLVGLLLARGRTLVFDEFHQRFGPQGSMATVALAWSRSSPWGWLIWQSAIVGFLAFVTGAVRFGPVRSGIRRARRSPLEHVRALATALSAARGHDVAIASIVNGLRRRLQAGEARPGAAAEPWPQWVQRLGETGRSAELRQHVSRLLTHATPGQPAAAVRDAAHTVEDVWQALHR